MATGKHKGSSRVNIPVVSLGCVGQRLLANSIAPSHQQGGFLAVTHLLELGHRKIGCITGPAVYDSSLNFWRGYQDAMEEYDLSVDPLLLFQGPYGVETGHTGFRKLIDHGITAIVTASDLIACGVWHEATQKGLTIPDDLSIVGYGDSFPTSYFNGELTSITMHFDRIARKAVNLIRKWDECNGPLPPETIFPSLISRKSSAPPQTVPAI